MIYFINTDVLPNKATNQYLLNLGVKNSSYRRNVTGDSRTDPYIHRLVNIMLRQARALGWTNLNLNKLHIRTGNQKDYLRLKDDHAAIFNLQQKDLEEIIKTQIQNYIGKVAPRAKCLRAGKPPIDIPMIIEWLPEKGLYWTPPMLYREVTEEVLEYARKKGIEIDEEKGTTYVVYDYDGNTIPVEGVKQCAQCQQDLVIGTGHSLGRFSGEQVLRCSFRKCVTPIEGGESIQKEWLDSPGEQKGLRTVPACFGPDESGREYGDPEFNRKDTVTFFKIFDRASILGRFAVSPLPFIPAKWYKSAGGKLRAVSSDQVERHRHTALLEYFKEGAIAQPDDKGFIKAFEEREVTYNIEAVVNSEGYWTPTGNHVRELALEYVDMKRVIELQRSGSPSDLTPAEDPFQWQRLALQRFRDSSFFGMVQACTGSGKTVFCANAIREVYAHIMYWEESDASLAIWAREQRSVCVNIVVPTIALLNQWHEFLTGATPIGKTYAGETLGITDVGRHGGGFREKLQAVNVFVVNTAARYLGHIMGDPEDPNFFDNLAPESKKQIPDHLLVGEDRGVGWLKEFHEKYPHQFLIVDEAHRTAAPTFRRIYDSHKEYLLMVSATFPDNEDRFEYLESQATNPEEEGAETPPVDEDSPWAFSTEEDPSDTNVSSGGMLCYYKYPHALKKGNISDFNLNYIRISLTRREQEIYDLLTKIIDELKIEARQQAKALDKSDGQVVELIDRIDKGLSEVEGGAPEGVQVPEVFYASEKELNSIRAAFPEGGGSVEDALDATIVRVEKDGRTLLRGRKKAKKDSYAVFMMKVLGGARARISWSSGARLQVALDLLIDNLKKGKSIIVFHKSVDGAAALYKLLYERGWGCAPYIVDQDPETGEPMEDQTIPKTYEIQRIEKILSNLQLAKDALLHKRRIAQKKLNSANSKFISRREVEEPNSGLRLDEVHLRGGRVLKGEARWENQGQTLVLETRYGSSSFEKKEVLGVKIIHGQLRPEVIAQAYAQSQKVLATQARDPRELSDNEQSIFLKWKNALEQYRMTRSIEKWNTMEKHATELEGLGIRVQAGWDDVREEEQEGGWSRIRGEPLDTKEEIKKGLIEDLRKIIRKTRHTLDAIKTGGDNLLGLPSGQRHAVGGGRPSGGWPVFPDLEKGDQLQMKTPSELADKGLNWINKTIKLLINKKRPYLNTLYSQEGLQPGRDMIGLYHSNMPSVLRDEYLKAFKKGKIKCLISVQALLEGLDVPHCDVGVAVAADQSSIKIVQALGRVLRINKESPDKKEYYFIAAKGTKDAIVEAKFDKELRGQDNTWIIGDGQGPTVTEAPEITDEQRIAIQTEAGLPTTVEIASFIKELMPDRADWAEEHLTRFIEGNVEKPQLKIEEKMTDSEIQAAKEKHDIAWDEWRKRESEAKDDILDGETTFKQRVRVVHPSWVDPESDCLPIETREDDQRFGRSVLTTGSDRFAGPGVPKRPRVQSQKPKPAGPEPIQGELF